MEVEPPWVLVARWEKEPTVLGSITIEPQAYLLLCRYDYDWGDWDPTLTFGFSISSSYETIVLRDPDRNLVSTTGNLGLVSTWSPGLSFTSVMCGSDDCMTWARRNDGSYGYTYKATPGEANIDDGGPPLPPTAPPNPPPAPPR